MKNVGESLAGRAVYFELPPMSVGEIYDCAKPDVLRRLYKNTLPKSGKVEDKLVSPLPFMLKGCMPAILSLRSQEGYLRWWEGYVATYLERDLRQLSQIESLPDFRKVMEAVALRSGQLINQTDMARDAGVSQSSVYRYLNLLETTCLLKRIPSYSKNRTKRLIKSPKAYFIDPGLTSFLCAHHDEKALKSSRESGSIFESLILLHLTVLCEFMVPKAKIYYWRTTQGNEVDFVIEHGGSLIAIEVKLSATVGQDDIKSLKVFLSEYSGARLGVVLYTGQEVKYLAKNIITVPWTVFAGIQSFHNT